MKRKTKIIIVVIVSIVAAVVAILLVTRRKKGQTIVETVSGAVTTGYVPESFPLKKGMFGEKIRQMQEELKFSGRDLGTYGADGKFGDKTLAAVRVHWNNSAKTEVAEFEWQSMMSVRDMRVNVNKQVLYG